MTHEDFTQATLIKNRMRECEKLKETLVDPKMKIAEASAALARYFLSHPEEILECLDNKVQAWQQEFDNLGKCQNPCCQKPEPEEPEEPIEPEEPDGGDEGDDEGTDGDTEGTDETGGSENSGNKKTDENGEDKKDEGEDADQDTTSL